MESVHAAKNTADIERGRARNGGHHATPFPLRFSPGHPGDYTQNVNGPHQNRRRQMPSPDIGQGSQPSRVACDET